MKKFGAACSNWESDADDEHSAPRDCGLGGDHFDSFLSGIRHSVQSRHSWRLLVCNETVGMHFVVAFGFYIYL